MRVKSRCHWITVSLTQTPSLWIKTSRSFKCWRPTRPRRSASTGKYEKSGVGTSFPLFIQSMGHRQCLVGLSTSVVLTMSSRKVPLQQLQTVVIIFLSARFSLAILRAPALCIRRSRESVTEIRFALDDGTDMCLKCLALLNSGCRLRCFLFFNLGP